jgi:UDP-N-acetylmuramate dehydrogenase
MLGIIKQNILLKKLSYLNVGGITRHFFMANSIKSLLSVLEYWIKKYGTEGINKILVIGGATNILFSDDIYNGLIIYNKISFFKIINPSTVFVGSGTSMKSLLNYCFKNKFVGLEWASGLPGSVGGAIRGNAGAFGGEIKNSVLKVVSVDINSKGNISLAIRSKKECHFNYRSSIYKRKNKEGGLSIIVGVYFKLKKVSSTKNARGRAKEIKNYRWTKHPMNMPSLGSTFKNVSLDLAPKKVIKLFFKKIKNDPFPILPVALLLDASNLKGLRVGGAQFSEKHPNFIINTGNSKSSDVRKLIAIAKKRVWSKFGIKLEEEIEIMK